MINTVDVICTVTSTCATSFVVRVSSDGARGRRIMLQPIR